MNKQFFSASLFLTASLLSVGVAPHTASAQSDTLRVGIATLPPSRGMPHSHTGALSGYTYSAIFDFLAVANQNGEMVPALSTGWKNTSPKTWQFTLRPNVKFSNGEALTPGLLEDTVKWYLSDEGKATLVGRSIGQVISGVKMIDANTIEFESKESNPAIPAQIYAMPIFEPKAFRERGMDGFAVKPVGSGPYQVTRWDPEMVQLEAVPGSWRAPKLPKMTLVPLPDATARVQALLSDQVDIVPALTFDAVKQVEASGRKADFYPAPYVLSWAFFPTHRDTPFKDQRVRLAANLAIDREGINSNLLLGKSIPATQPASPLTFGYNPNVKPFPFDPAQAKKLLAEAGYPNGFEFDAVVLPGNFPADNDIYQQAAQNLGSIGIKVNLRAITIAEFVKVITSPGDPKEYGKGWGEKVFAHQQDFSVDVVPDASQRLIGTWGCRRPVPFWCNAEEDALLTKAQAEFDVEKRRKILQDLMQVFHDNAPALFLVNVVDVVGRSAKVENAKLTYRVLNYHEMSKN